MSGWRRSQLEPLSQNRAPGDICVSTSLLCPLPGKGGAVSTLKNAHVKLKGDKEENRFLWYKVVFLPQEFPFQVWLLLTCVWAVAQVQFGTAVVQMGDGHCQHPAGFMLQKAKKEHFAWAGASSFWTKSAPWACPAALLWFLAALRPVLQPSGRREQDKIDITWC